jgi:hypothetical protein
MAAVNWLKILPVYFIAFILSFSIEAQQPPVVPKIDKAMRAQLKSIYKSGINQGNRPNVFAKAGDSITRNTNFLKDIGCGIEVLAGNQRLAPTIQHFRGFGFPDSFTTAWCGNANSFSRDSLTSQNGWTVDEPLRRFANPASECPPPYDNPLRCELHLIQPSIALVMFGTNDLESNDQVNYQKKLIRILQEIIVNGVVPVLSTIPPRLDDPAMGARVGPYNNIIQNVAEMLQIPLWNYWLALQDPSMINQGMDGGGIHPNALNDIEAAVFTSDGLRYGFNQRNFTAVEVLEKLRRVVQGSRPADSSVLPNFTIVSKQPIAPVAQGATVIFKLKIVRINFTKKIQFTLAEQPAGVSATFSTNTRGTSLTVTLSVRNGVPTGEHRITIRGQSGKLERLATFPLIITD